MNIPTPPGAQKQHRRIEQLGRVRTDDYGWMKDENWQAVLRDPGILRADIREHLLAENAYTVAVLEETVALQGELVAEMKGRMKDDDSAVPKPDGPFMYYRRYDAGAQHPVFARRPRDGGAEDVLLDADAAAKGLAYYSVAQATHSPDHELFGFAEDVQGSEVYRVRLRNIATGAAVGDAIESCSGNFAFSPCAKFVFWTFRDESGRPTKIFRRLVGGADDVLVYEEKDQGFFIHVETAPSGGSIFIGCGNQETSEVWRIPGDDPTAKPAVIASRQAGHKYDVEDDGGRLIIRTNADGAVDFKLMTAKLTDNDPAQWTEFLAHRPGRYITGVLALAGHVVHQERMDANDSIIVTPRDGAPYTIAVDEPAYMLRLDPGFEYNTATIRTVYSSPTTPSQWFDYDLKSRERTLRKTQEIPSGHDPALYETRRLTATAKDGAQIPVTLLMRRDTPADGSAPVHLYGYGSYGIAMPAGFSANILSLVDRGWIHVIAHIRGGTEKGWNWFLEGRGPKKMNTFTDFIAVADHLCASKLARPKNIVAHGGSAGGLLMGAVLNLRPDLWAGVIANVPFVDVLNTMSDTTLPLTPPEWPEWGNPLVDPAAYDTIAAYSPYDNIREADYPAVLALGGLSDPRVTYWEPAKFIARLRDHSTGVAPALLKIDMEAGHGGAAGRFDALKTTGLIYAFAVWAVAAAQKGYTSVIRA